MKTIMIYKNETTIGFRPTAWDREVGETITNNGEKYEVIGMVKNATQSQLKALNFMVNKVGRLSKGVDITKTITLGGFKIPTVVGYKTWKNDSARDTYIMEFLKVNI